jgi:hypothetical protein
LGAALAQLLEQRAKLWQAALWTFIAAATIGVGGSVISMFQREHWFSYRWLDPFEEIVAEINASDPNPLVYTNSGSVMFYMGDDHGYLGAQGIRSLYGEPYEPKAFEYPLTELSRPVFERRAESTRQIVVVHHNALFPYSAVADMLQLEMERHGFVRAAESGFLAVSPLFARFHPLIEGRRHPLDQFRIVVARFEKPPSAAP